MQDEPDARIADLVRRAQAAHQTDYNAAFDQLMARVRPVVAAQSIVRTHGNLHHADEVTQEICARIWRGLPALQSPQAFWSWLQSISQNVWADRLRRTKQTPAHVSLDTAAENALAGWAQNPKTLPLSRLLHEETGRELVRALRLLPRANRDALLWHVWGGVPYDEIARLACVPVSTVEGRIYRAKQQMRRLLPDDIAPHTAQRKNLPMSSSSLLPTAAPAAQIAAQTAFLPPSVVLWTQRMAALVDGGVRFSVALESLHDLPEPYGEASRKMGEGVRNGELPSHLMDETAAIWGPFLMVLMRVGETGGVLEETLRCASYLCTREAEHLRLETTAPFLLAPVKTITSNWNDYTPYQKAVTRYLFCTSAGLLLSCGVPLAQTLDGCAAFLPDEAQNALRESAETATLETVGAVLENLGVFPAFVFALLNAAQGGVDAALDKAGEAFGKELSFL